jgi:hypothetical protein
MNLLHNMSAPPRTQFEFKGAPVTRRIILFSLTYALLKAGLAGKEVPLTGDPLRDACGEWNRTRKAVLEIHKSTADLFQKTGPPVFPEARAQFLVGWRPLNQHTRLSLTDCDDPRLCAGVFSRCSGLLYLPRREPDLTWERLLAAPIAFEHDLLAIP